MADEWIGIIETTRAKYMKGASDLTIRKRLLLAMLQNRGRITYNHSGDELKWDVEFSEPPVSAIGDGGVIDFSNHDAYRQLEIDWRGYVATDTMSMKQRAMNKGDEAIVNVFSKKQKKLMKGIKNKFCGELYRDGSAAGRENNIHGLETFMTTDGNTVVADRLANPSDTYGGISTALGNLGGTWSDDLSTYPNATLATDWPDGNGDSEYDFMSPKLVNWGSTSWDGTSNTWEANAWRVVSQVITWLCMTGGDEANPSLMPMASNLFQGYKNAQEVKTRIAVPFKEADDLGLGGLGALNQDGCGLYPDFDCPVNVGYALKLESVEVRSLFKELFWMEGPDRDPRTQWSYLWGTGFYGNVTYEPKHTAKMANYADA